MIKILFSTLLNFHSVCGVYFLGFSLDGLSVSFELILGQTVRLFKSHDERLSD